jgi:transglutaminase-like putative cysteine protease
MILIAAVVGTMMLGQQPVQVVSPNVIETRTIQITQTVTLHDVPEGARHVRMWVPIPSDAGRQRVTDIKVESAPGHWQLVHPQSGKGDFVYVDVMNPKTGSIPVTVSATIETQGVHVPLENVTGGSIQKELFEAELDTKSPLMTSDDRVKKLANEACGNESDIAKQVMLLAKKTGEVADHYSINKNVPTCGRGAASDCMDNGGGCCTDLHSLFIAMCRERGIPAKIQFGYRTLDKNDGKTDVDPGYRCWASVFVPGMGWVDTDVVASDSAGEDVDLRWGTISSTRVWLWEGRSFELSPPTSAGSVHTMLYGFAEIDGKPVEVLPGHDGTPSQLRRTITFNVLSNDRTAETPSLPQ